jgi:hypothetical protein
MILQVLVLLVLPLLVQLPLDPLLWAMEVRKSVRRVERRVRKVAVAVAVAVAKEARATVRDV